MASRNGRVRLTLEFSPESFGKLQDLANRTGSTRTEVLRKALTLFEMAYRARTGGKHFGVTADKSSLETEIIGV
jgi:predicted transcriptional regulator